ncbi:hypothetical protein [Merismopedia glauca]|nr:hypothetical protein [Merismopedia glauca]
MHTFLMEAGRWQLRGNWLERHQETVGIKGQVLVAWSQDNWFTMVTKLVFAQSIGEKSEVTKRQDLSFLYKGRLNSAQNQYTFVLQHSMLGRLEGEGWVAPETIVQRYWAIGDIQGQDKNLSTLRQQCSGFESWYRLNERTYHVSSSIMTGHNLFSMMEALLEKH